MKLFAQLTKVDEEKRLVYGRAVDETPDRADEIFDYDSSVPYFKAWSAEVAKASDGASVGNLRAMHGKVAAGKLTDIQFNDTDKAIDVVAKVVDDNEWKKVLEGVYTGFSIGGSYVGKPKVEKSADGKELKRYTAKPAELSLVDRPCIPTATFFQVQKADGSTSEVQFLAKGGDELQEDQVDQEAPADPPLDNNIEAEKSDVPPAAKDVEYQVVGSPEDVEALAKMMHEQNWDVKYVLEALKSNLEANAKVNKASALLKREQAGELRKGMYAVSRLADLLQSAQYLTENVIYEETAEQDVNSQLPSKMKSVLSLMAETLVAMVQEETAEMLANYQDSEPDVEVLELADKVGGLEKIGARNAKSDQERIQKAHDLMVELGGTCTASDKSDHNHSLLKADDVQKLVDEALTKALAPLQETITKQATELETLKNQPAKPKGVLKVISKADDTSSSSKEPEVTPIMKDGAVDDAATAIKKLHLSGGQPLAFVPGRSNV